MAEDVSLRPDGVLRLFVRLADKEQLHNMDVTLTVGGTLISGKMVGKKQYFEGVVEKAAESIGGDTATSLFKLFAGIASEPHADELKPDFIHLKNAKILKGDGTFIADIWWRGRLSAIDGFSFGSLN